MMSQGLVPGKKARWLCYHGDSRPSAQHLWSSPASSFSWIQIPPEVQGDKESTDIFWNWTSSPEQAVSSPRGFCPETCE